MPRYGEITFTIDRPIDAVFDFLADGEHDRLFSKAILEIAKTTDGPVGVGSVYRSKRRDLGLIAWHTFELTEFTRPNSIRWRELTRGPVVVSDGGYSFRSFGGTTQVRFDGTLVGRGPGKLLVGFVSSRVRAGFPAFAVAIKATVEAAV